MIKEFKKFVCLLTTADKILVVVLTLISLLSIFTVNLITKPGEVALIRAEGSQELRKNLMVADKFVLSGPVGESSIEIKNGSIHIIDSDCPQKLCIRQGTIHRVGEIIVCVPNRITIWIEGKRANKFDAITG